MVTSYLKRALNYVLNFSKHWSASFELHSVFSDTSPHILRASVCASFNPIPGSQQCSANIWFILSIAAMLQSLRSRFHSDTGVAEGGMGKPGKEARNQVEPCISLLRERHGPGAGLLREVGGMTVENQPESTYGPVSRSSRKSIDSRDAEARRCCMRNEQQHSERVSRRPTPTMARIVHKQSHRPLTRYDREHGNRSAANSAGRAPQQCDQAEKRLRLFCPGCGLLLDRDIGITMFPADP